MEMPSIIKRNNQKPKIVACMVSHSAYFADARIKNYVGTLLREGYEIDVFALGDDDSEAGVNFTRVQDRYYGENPLRFIASYLSFFIKAFCLVTSGFMKKKYRFIHVHNMPNFMVFVATIPRMLGAKVILDVHDTMPEHYATKYELELRHPLIKCLKAEELLSGTFADLIITTNDLHKITLLSRGHNEKKIAVIMNLANERIFFPRQGVRNHSANTSNLTLVYHGTIARRLGIDLILEAIYQLHEECPDLRLILIGDGEFMPQVKSLIHNYGIYDRVTVTGSVPVEEVPKYLAPADLGIIGNRRYTELQQNWMLPVKMLEYAALEMPTIAPRLRIIEWYFDDTNAIFYDPDNVEELAKCIKEVYYNKMQIESFKPGLRRFNQLYSWKIMEKIYLDLIR
jgi:glycosyltransferase involved in cell wall biosynthesis